MKRESFGSRLGFILVSAGCAIGIGNVWKFPYICGAYGGAAFILIYLCFLVILGIPVLVAEFAVGRGSHTSVAKCFDKLAPAGSGWKPLKFIGIIGCYMLMMFYTTVGGWMIYYCVKSLRGDFVGATPEAVTQSFSDMLGNAPTMMLWMVIICLIGFAVCFMGLQNGIEKISKVMMSALLIIMVILAVHSVMMEGAGEGIRFYLVPDFQKIKEAGVGNVVFAALSQSFFTLSIGIGAMLIFGSYLDKSRSLTGEAVSITVLDTFVALTAGFIIIPACFSYNLDVGAGPSLLFVTLPTILQDIPLGRLFAIILYLAMIFAGISSLQNMFEAVAESLLHKFPKLSRTAVLGIICALCLGAGLFMEPISKWGPWMDLVSIYIIPIGATLGAVSWFYVMKKDELLDAVNTGSGRTRGALWYSVGCYVYVPIAVVLCFVALFKHISF